jgi:hypothetical protein
MDVRQQDPSYISSLAKYIYDYFYLNRYVHVSLGSFPTDLHETSILNRKYVL